MRTKTTMIGLVLGGIAASIMLVNCNQQPKDDTETKEPPAVDTIQSVNLKTFGSFQFPTDSNTIYTWLNNRDTTSIYNHAWNIWAGLTANSGEVYKGDSLLVYETWLGISEIKDMTQSNTKTSRGKVARTPLAKPNQFVHAAIARARFGGGTDTSAGKGNNFWVTVAYSPAAANYALTNQILKQSVLDSYKRPGAIGAIPAFPSDAITIKPTYYVGKRSDGYIRMPAWPGTPNPPRAFDPANDTWDSYVFVDVNNGQTPGKPLTPVKQDEPRTEASTCNLTDFLYFTVDSTMAAYLNQQQQTQGVVADAGDLAMLVAMHVTSKEISNWTWQTYYWAPNPGTPFAPSSSFAATLQNSYIKGAARHYAVSTAYNMVWPNQPITGGTNKGVTAVIGFNPFLEAGFGPNVFASNPSKLNKNFIYGVQTNCMSCHVFATADTGSAALGYSTDQYVDLNDTGYFNNRVRVDFAWSIQGNIITNK
ncbi:MAG: hypothetical protein H6585_11190 [Flavobacteriales bacterium]|nr:hypothetical protein [Flavobacteriales bacterium]